MMAAWCLLALLALESSSSRKQSSVTVSLDPELLKQLPGLELCRSRGRGCRQADMCEQLTADQAVQ